MPEDANYYDRFADHKEQPQKENKKEQKQEVASTAFSLAKVFGYMFIGLLITSVIALGLGYLFNYLIVLFKDSPENTEKLLIGMIAGLIVCAIALIVMSFVVPIVAMKNKHSVLVPSIIYTILM